MDTGIKKTPFTKKSQTKGPHLMEILKDVARHYGVYSGDVISMSSGKSILLGRGIYCYVSWKLTDAPLREIGALIGINYTDVLYHRDKVAYWIKKADPKWVDEWLDYLENTELWGAYEKIR